jgi:YggT family protein
MFAAHFVANLLQVFALAIFVRVLLSWVVRDYGNPVFRLLVDVTEPVLAPIRRAIPTPGGLDFSPMIAIIVITLISQMLGGGGLF